ncbi:LytTR family DNA-binding domain-containing protein [Proteiniphilum sp.]|uniref:LytR/AlgR family response regulator transcription factor n=1 Tax=Proteiniphilum sp. TaxID=1926877 RepID=UPI002B21BDAB|nr:LytTR family DNA-binding domain-containing protein [Proteiniphilum sp.]MEA4915998.1 LytTR family DNA-binding domain-containing protein [Proteiniphilum sp.]
MKALRSIAKLICQPFRLFATLKQRMVFASGMFVFSLLFLLLFIPFNITEWIVYTSPFKVLQLPGLGVIIGILIYISQLLQYFLFRNNSIKVYHLLIGFCIDIILISIPLSLLYSIPANSFWIEFKQTLDIAIPLAILWYILGISLMALWDNYYNKETSLFQQETPKQTIQAERINIKDGNGQLRLSLRPEDLIYFESADNYVIVFFRKTQRISREVVRNSLKNIENDLNVHNCVRCHRSFIVNIVNVTAIKKKGRSYIIELDGIDTPIPISRGYVKVISDLLTP